MSEWKEIRLNEVCDLVAGYAFKSSDFGEYPSTVIRIGDIKPPFVEVYNAIGVDIQNYDIHKLAKFEIKRGDFILAMTGATIGKIGLYTSNKKSYINQRVLSFRPKENINRQFLYYYLNDRPFASYITNHVDSESAQPNISAGTIGKYTLSVPSLTEQKKIAGILSSLDEKIETNRKINARLEELAKAIFKSWFIDFEPFGGKMPEDWQNVTLSDIGDIIGGATPSKEHPEYYAKVGNGIAWLTPKDLSETKAKFTARGSLDITNLGYQKCSTKLMPCGSILFSSRAPIGYVSIAINEICTNQGFKSFVPKEVGTAFSYYLLKTLTPEIENKSTGSTFKEASGSLMKSLQVFLPDKEILSKFEEICTPIFDMQRDCEIESTRLAELRDTLLPKLMSGKIKVD